MASSYGQYDGTRYAMKKTPGKRSNSTEALAKRAMAEAANGGSKKTTRKKATRKTTKKTTRRKKRDETGQLAEAVKVVNKARRLLGEAGCSVPKGRGR